MNKKYVIQIQRNGGSLSVLSYPKGLKKALQMFADYVKWYEDSFQRIDTEFSFQLVNSETNERIDFVTLPMKPAMV